MFNIVYLSLVIYSYIVFFKTFNNQYLLKYWMVHGGKPSSNMKLLNPQFQYETFKPPVPIWNFLTPQFQYETFKLPVPIWNFLTPSSNLKLRHGYLIIIVEKLKCKLYYWPAKNFTNTSMRHSKLSRYITRSYSLMSKFHDSLSHNIR